MRKKKADRSEICRIARELFIKKGYGAVSIDEICEAVGISKPTFYAANLTKQELLIDAFRIPEEDLQTRLSKEDGHLARLCELSDLIFGKLDDYDTPMLAALGEAAMDGPVFEEIMNETWKNEMSQVILQAQEEDEILVDAEPHILTDMICSYIIGFFVQKILGQEEGTFEAYRAGLHAVLRVPIGVPL